MAKPTEVPGLSGDTPLAVAGPLLVRARLADVSRYAKVLQRAGEPDVDAVHDMRVAARRLRAAIALFADAELSALEPEVKALQDALGAVRDLQILRTWLRAAARRRRTRSASALLDWAGQGRGKAERKLRSALRAWDGAVAAEVQRAASSGSRGGRLGGHKVGEVARTRLATLARRAERVRHGASPGAAHRLRIAAKKVRYLAELVEPAHPAPAHELLERLVPLQELLGDLHDVDVRIGRLEAVGEEGTARERRAASDLLVTARADRLRLERGLVAEIGRWRADGLVKALRRGFAR